ncbi:TRAP transporter substrate-binding protein [Clostridium estertheticum]|uniref:TRAP transporter substrate-binding protein n=1 Tax=Clostridium estertheticum TaxID=238834 RepID=UPI001CF36506|nr:TRAP transporter substrate-binding protein [Clostridium estertheticum]MCB2352532.1 TRAP transporter substrate-binding protein [Clostridium estertheticum]WAG39848.1 TRAP transporter substrate-binding protein [Clostridium estertheticum]
MNKKKFIAIFSCLVLTVGVLAGCGSKTPTATKDAGKTATKSVTLRLSDNQPAGYPTIIGDQAFAKEVEAKTNGRIKIKVFLGSQLGDEKSTIEQLQFGGIDAIRIGAAPLAEFNKQIGALILPYLYKDKDQMFRVLEGPVGEKMFASLSADSKIVGLSWVDSGARNFYNTKKDIKTPADLKGLKIRVQESKPMMDMVKALGASSTPMAYGDVYSALQTGVVDGAENNWPSYLSSNHYQVAKHITIDEHTRVPEMIAFSKISWDKISADDQKIVKAAAIVGANVERVEWLKQSDAAQAKIVKKGGVTITKLTTDEQALFQKAVKPMYTAHPEWKETIDAILATK